MLAALGKLVAKHDQVQDALDVAADERKRDWWVRYLKGEAEFRGVPAPAIRSSPAYAPTTSNRYEYQVVAADPDGDRPLRYERVEGPTGMQLGAYSGLVRWEIPRSVSGEVPVEVAVIDPQGAEVHQRFALRIGWDTPPANRD